ncbi:MAG: hypothetical protein WDM92_16605 [Caulobacteraceae bacterium]
MRPIPSAEGDDGRRAPDDIDPSLAALIEALAERDAARDYAAAHDHARRPLRPL